MPFSIGSKLVTSLPIGGREFSAGFDTIGGSLEGSNGGCVNLFSVSWGKVDILGDSDAGPTVSDTILILKYHKSLKGHSGRKFFLLEFLSYKT